MKLLVEMLDAGVFEFDVYSNLTNLQDIFDANNFSASHVMQMVVTSFINKGIADKIQIIDELINLFIIGKTRLF